MTTPVRDAQSPEPVIEWLGGPEPTHYLMGVPSRDLSEAELAQMIFGKSGKTVAGPEHEAYEGHRAELVDYLTGFAGGAFYREIKAAKTKPTKPEADAAATD